MSAAALAPTSATPHDHGRSQRIDATDEISLRNRRCVEPACSGSRRAPGRQGGRASHAAHHSAELQGSPEFRITCRIHCCIRSANHNACRERPVRCATDPLTRDTRAEHPHDWAVGGESKNLRNPLGGFFSWLSGARLKSCATGAWSGGANFRPAPVGRSRRLPETRHHAGAWAIERLKGSDETTPQRSCCVACFVSAGPSTRPLLSYKDARVPEQPLWPPT